MPSRPQQTAARTASHTTYRANLGQRDEPLSMRQQHRHSHVMQVAAQAPDEDIHRAETDNWPTRKIPSRNREKVQTPYHLLTPVVRGLMLAMFVILLDDRG